MQLRKYSFTLAYLACFILLLAAYPVAYAFILPQEVDDIPPSPYLRIDPEKIVMSSRDDRVPCGECHALEYDTWKETPHSTGFDTMHRSKSAQSILERMDFRLAKRESLCLRCHYTATQPGEQAKAIAGVSCESCHGAARDWEAVHNDYGPGADHATESAEHKMQRIQASIDGGMLRPSDNLYGVAANCFECHTVPSEELVDVGKHASGSDFELVEWSENIRHNFIQAQWSSDESNRAPTAERKRVMYVVGRMLDYEYSMRGLAEATTSGRYAKAMERRITSAVRELEKIAFIADIAEVDDVLKNHKNVQLIPDNKEPILAVSEQVRSLGQAFTMGQDGSGIEPIDRLIAGENVSLPTPAVAESASEPAPGQAPGNAASNAAPATGSNPSSTAPPPSQPAQPTFQVVGQKRTVPAWFTSSQYDVTLANCGRCHGQADEWLVSDPHYSTARIIQSESAQAVRIATNYGLTRAQMKQGNQICMQCHGTIPAGSESASIFDGVTCEGCHGPSSGYEKPHRKDRSQGFSLGMVELKNPSILAGNCSRCHLITDERLISSGHPSGEGYNVANGLASIKHWPDDENIERDGPYPEVDPGAVRSAFASIASSRPVPNVPIAPLQTAQPSVASNAAPAPAPRRTTTSSSTTGAQASSAPPRPPPQRPVQRVPRPATPRPQAINLPPTPSVSDSTSTEDILLLVKERLELLYQAVGRNQ